MHVCSVKTKNPPEQILPLEKKFIGTSIILARGKTHVFPSDPLLHLHIPGSNWNSSDDQWFSIAGPQDCQFVFPLNIIDNALFLFCTYSLHTIKCSDDFGYCSYSHLIFPILFQKAKTYVTRDGLFAFDLCHFQTTCVLITRLSDCNPIRAFETFDISKAPINKTSKFWMFWYK